MPRILEGMEYEHPKTHHIVRLYKVMPKTVEYGEFNAAGTCISGFRRTSHNAFLGHIWDFEYTNAGAERQREMEAEAERKKFMADAA